LPITATPATMESAMAVRLRALSAECEMNVDGVGVGRALSGIRERLFFRCRSNFDFCNSIRQYRY
jgi:hypothetical protein